MRLSAMETSMLPDLRRRRTEAVAHMVLHALEPWIDRLDRLQTWAEQSQAIDEKSPESRPPDPRREIYRALFDLLYATGYEVITDADRAAAGLDPRNVMGLTDQELRIMEDRRIEAMLRPMPFIMPVSDVAR